MKDNWRERVERKNAKHTPDKGNFHKIWKFTIFQYLKDNWLVFVLKTLLKSFRSCRIFPCCSGGSIETEMRRTVINFPIFFPSNTTTASGRSNILETQQSSSTLLTSTIGKSSLLKDIHISPREWWNLCTNLVRFKGWFVTREVRQLNPAVRILVMIKQKVKKEKVMMEFGTCLFHQLPL